MKIRQWTIYILLILTVLAVGLSFLPTDKKEISPFAVWWWDATLDESYLDFAEDNGVNEIYYNATNFDQQTAQFVEKANKKGMKVFYLSGHVEWLEDENEKQKLFDEIEDFKQYQTDFAGQKFEGVHFDIEPHQSANWQTNRIQLLQSLVELADYLKETYQDVKFDYDIPFWFDDQITHNGQTKEVYKHMIDIADRVVVMSYRDTAEKIYNVGEDEVEYAKAVGKTLLLSVETTTDNPDEKFVSFEEEGSGAMLEAISSVKEKMPKHFGFAVHNVKTWKNMIA